MAKKRLKEKASFKKLEASLNKDRKHSSRKVLAEFVKSEAGKSKIKASKTKKLSKTAHSQLDIKKAERVESISSSEPGEHRFANTDASTWRKMTDDAAIQKPVTFGAYASNSELQNARQFSQTSRELLSTASILLAIATGIAILFALIMAFLPGGKDAVPAMGGVLQATAPLETAQVVFFLDILFPITFGTGFALLATAFQTRGNRPVVRMILTALLFVLLADFSENALVFKALTGGQTYPVQWPLTVIKYALLGMSAVLLSSILLVSGIMGTIVLLFLRYFFPLSIALLVAGIGGRLGSDIVGATFPVGLLLLAIYARILSAR